MPQSSWTANLSGSRFTQPIQIAQGDAPGKPGVSENTHVEVQKDAGEKEHSAGEIPDPGLLFPNSVLVALFLIVFAIAARRRISQIPKGYANFAEFVAESLNNFTVGIIGEEGRKYTPLVGTIFLYILLMNLIGLIPGFHSPTTNITFTLALGLTVFVYVQFQGIRNMGPVNYVQHFTGPMPWQGILIPIKALLLLPVELISEGVKPFTLAIRLFGNIFGEDVIIGVLAGLAGTLGGAKLGWIPIQFPLLLLAVLTSLVQAMVFTILTCIYLSLMSHHDHDEEHGAAWEGAEGSEGSYSTTQVHTAGH